MLKLTQNEETGEVTMAVGRVTTKANGTPNQTYETSTDGLGQTVHTMTYTFKTPYDIVTHCARLLEMARKMEYP